MVGLNMSKKINKNSKNHINLLYSVAKGKIIETFSTVAELFDYGIIDYEILHKLSKWCMNNIGIGATFNRKVRLVELPNGKRVWLAEIVDNDFEEKVADWIFDENGNTLLCYPDPKEFDRILIEIDRKHGLDEFGEPIKKVMKKVTA